MEGYTFLRTAIAQHVMELFNSSLMELPYHNFHHTHSVVEHAAFLANYYALDEEDTFIVNAAAWFHDTGHLTGTLIGHEAVSALMMKDYLRDKNVEEPVISRIEECIAATSIYAKPGSLPEMILCDADTWHLGTPEFRQTDPLVKAEMELRLKKRAEDWVSKTIDFLESHRFYTSYCQTNLEAGKAQILHGCVQLQRNRKNNSLIFLPTYCSVTARNHAVCFDDVVVVAILSLLLMPLWNMMGNTIVSTLTATIKLELIHSMLQTNFSIQKLSSFGIVMVCNGQKGRYNQNGLR